MRVKRRANAGGILLRDSWGWGILTPSRASKGVSCLDYECCRRSMLAQRSFSLLSSRLATL
jgi:hypothetical protein